MAKRATCTMADLKRAIRVADAMGKVVIQTPAGIAFVPAGSIAQPAPQESEVEAWFRANGNDTHPGH